MHSLYIYAPREVYIQEGIYIYIHIHIYPHTRREQLQIIPYDLIAVSCEEGRDIDVNTGVKMKLKPE